MYQIKNFLENDDIRVVEEKGNIKIVEYLRDLSVPFEQALEMSELTDDPHTIAKLSEENVIKEKLQEIDFEIERENKLNEIINKTEYLLMFPYMGRKIPEFDNTNFRELIYKSYRILYKVNSNIYILNVFHHSRDFLNSVNIINN